MINKKKSFLTLLTVAFASTLMAQNGSNSAYSRYGLGTLADQSQGFNKGMAGLSLGMRDGKSVNFQNPASYSAIDSLTFIFDVGMSFHINSMDFDGKKVNANNSTFDYANVAFRAFRNVGMSVGIMPFSSVGYEFSSSNQMVDVDNFGSKTSTLKYSGNGGLHQVYIGAGWNPIKPLSIGANVSYLWGEINNSATTTFSETTINSLARYYSASIYTYKLDFGAQYNLKLNKNNALTIGATYGLGHDINDNAEFINQKLSSSSIISADTISAPNAFQLPHSFGVGITWQHNDNLTLGFDYSSQMWKDVKFPELVSAENYTPTVGNMMNRHKFTIGAEYQPNPRGIYYAQHLRYRAGFSYTSPYTKVNGVDGPTSYLVSFGVGIPIFNRYSSRSIVNVSAQYEHLNPKTAGFTKENIFRLCLGITFNEKWFMKWKVE